MVGLRKKKRGNKTVRDRKITEQQEMELKKIITEITPDQLKMSFGLWSCEAVRQLILDRCGIDYALQTLSTILKRGEFTWQRSLKRAYEQRPAEKKQWGSSLISVEK